MEDERKRRKEARAKGRRAKLDKGQKREEARVGAADDGVQADLERVESVASVDSATGKNARAGVKAASPSTGVPSALVKRPLPLRLQKPKAGSAHPQHPVLDPDPPQGQTLTPTRRHKPPPDVKPVLPSSGPFVPRAQSPDSPTAPHQGLELPELIDRLANILGPSFTLSDISRIIDATAPPSHSQDDAEEVSGHVASGSASGDRHVGDASSARVMPWLHVDEDTRAVDPSVDMESRARPLSAWDSDSSGSASPCESAMSDAESDVGNRSEEEGESSAHDTVTACSGGSIVSLV